MAVVASLDEARSSPRRGPVILSAEISPRLHFVVRIVCVVRSRSCDHSKARQKNFTIFFFGFLFIFFGFLAIDFGTGGPRFYRPSTPNFKEERPFYSPCAGARSPKALTSPTTGAAASSFVAVSLFHFFFHSFFTFFFTFFPYFFFQPFSKKSCHPTNQKSRSLEYRTPHWIPGRN